MVSGKQDRQPLQHSHPSMPISYMWEGEGFGMGETRGRGRDVGGGERRRPMVAAPPQCACGEVIWKEPGQRQTKTFFAFMDPRSNPPRQPRGRSWTQNIASWLLPVSTVAAPPQCTCGEVIWKDQASAHTTPMRLSWTQGANVH